MRKADFLSRSERAKYRETCKGDPGASPPRTFVPLHDLHQREEESGLPQILLDRLSVRDEAIERVPDRIDAERLVPEIMANVACARTRYVLWQVGALGRTYKDLAKELGCSESRIHQIYGETVRKIRKGKI